MAIAFALGNSFWIEVFHIPRQTVLAGAAVSIELTLERAGQFLSAQCTFDHDNTLNVPESAEIAARITPTLSNAELIIGQDIAGVRVRMTNDNLTDEVFGAHVLVLMRGSGR